jgi:hypothetical protein
MEDGVQSTLGLPIALSFDPNGELRASIRSNETPSKPLGSVKTVVGALFRLNNLPQGLVMSTSHVYLNVYDIWDRNHYLFWMGFGVFHSGVVLRLGTEVSTEITYGGHPYEHSGVYRHQPGVPIPEDPSIAPLRASVFIGSTALSAAEVEEGNYGRRGPWYGEGYSCLGSCYSFAVAE